MRLTGISISHPNNRMEGTSSDSERLLQAMDPELRYCLEFKEAA
jgi:hypothetical protein